MLDGSATVLVYTGMSELLKASGQASVYLETHIQEKRWEDMELFMLPEQIGLKDAQKIAEEHGLRVDVLAEDSTPEGLAEALAAHGVVMRERAEEAGEDEWRPSKKRAAGRRKS